MVHPTTGREGRGGGGTQGPDALPQEEVGQGRDTGIVARDLVPRDMVGTPLTGVPTHRSRENHVVLVAVLRDLDDLVLGGRVEIDTGGSPVSLVMVLRDNVVVECEHGVPLHM